MSETITTSEAAALLNVNASRVRQLILSGRLPAEKHGRDWAIKREAVETYQRKSVGYPKGRSRKETGE
jgi:excisionase family DNA binding protein